ncbi:MAG: IreB family regulatory phosphoprotein [Clostridia bacterium]|nr:IreB family regulatory phosphoprotein [Clostridia bacterium]
MQNTEQKNIHNTDVTEAQRTLRDVYHALTEKGYNPVTQIVGYLLTEDPTYITNYAGARSLIRRVDRNDLLEEIVRSYFESEASV